MARYDVPITEGTTTSLEALRAMREGDAARDRGQLTEALRSSGTPPRKTRNSPWRSRASGSAAMNAHYEPEGIAALERAFALRDRVTLPERLNRPRLPRVHDGRSGEDHGRPAKLRRMYRPGALRRRLASHQLDYRQFDDALAEALEAQRLEPANSSTFSMCRWAYSAGRWADMRAAVEDAIVRGVATEPSVRCCCRLGS